MSKLVFVDVESVTLGAAPGSLWELAVIERTPEGDREWLWQVRPDLTIADPNALRIGKFYQRFRGGAGAEIESPFRFAEGENDDRPGYARSRTSETIARDLAKMLDGATLVGACTWFDAAHIEAFLRANGQAPAWHHRYIDVEALTAGKLGRIMPGLTKCADELEIAFDRDQAHTALADARLARDVFDAVMGVAS